MQFYLSIVLIISFAAVHNAYGDESKTDVSFVSTEQDQEVADFETENEDDELDDEAAKYRWLAPALFDELKERERRSANISHAESEDEEEEEQRKKKNRKNKGKGEKRKNKKNKKNKKKNKKKKLKKFKEEEEKIWFDHVGCYRDKGPKAWKRPELRAIKHLYLNNRGKIPSWDNFKEVVMACAQGAQAKGCPCFGVQFYGECWCDPLACETYDIYKDSQKCFKGVGLQWTNYVYKGKCGSEYGCCPDGAMPALGPNFQGCPDCTTAVDLCFVVDASGSIGKDNFEMMKDILIKLIRHFSVSDYYARICVIKYSNAPRRVFHLHQSQKLGFLRLEQKIRKMRYTKGGTRTGKALAMAYKMFKKSQRKLDGKVLKHDQALVVITDGLTNAKDIPTFRAATAALKSSGHVIAVGVTGQGYDAEKKRQQAAELTEIASSPQDLFYEASFEQVRDHVDPIARRACPLVYKKP